MRSVPPPTQPPVAQDAAADRLRFSQYYLQGERNLPDSFRLRVRLQTYIHQVLSSGERIEFGKRMAMEVGTPIDQYPNGEYDISAFIRGCELRDLFDAITIVYDVLSGRPQARGWMEFVAKCFAEERIAYTLTPACTVRHFVDVEYDLNRGAALECLKSPRWRAVAETVGRAYEDLDGEPRDTKASVRHVFEAAEIVCKIILGTGQDLDEALVNKDLRGWINRRYAREHGSIQQAHAQMVSSFGKWVAAGHPFRHGQQAEEPLAPSIDFAVLYVSQGASFIRWLVGLAG